MALRGRQKRFADFYLELGNAAEAARKAGYSEKAATGQGSRLLANADILAYIQERQAKADRKRIADADEVLTFYSSVMRGDIKDQFGLEAALDTRLKAADSLAKRFVIGGKDYGKNKREDDALTKSLREEAKKLEAERNAAK